MTSPGWKQLVEGWPWFQGEGRFPVLPNSEFMPPVRLGLRPYGTRDGLLLSEDDPWGWPVSEYEEGLTLRPDCAISLATSWIGSFPCAGPTLIIAFPSTSSRRIRTGRRSCTIVPGPSNTSASCCCCRWPCPLRRTTRRTCAGRFSATVNRVRPALSGRAFTPIRHMKCPLNKPSTSSALCCRKPTKNPWSGSRTCARLGFASCQRVRREG